jgi:hypothetical protein
MAIAPSSGAGMVDKEPFNPPIGVRATPTIHGALSASSAKEVMLFMRLEKLLFATSQIRFGTFAAKFFDTNHPRVDHCALCRSWCIPSEGWGVVVSIVQTVQTHTNFKEFDNITYKPRNIY